MSEDQATIKLPLPGVSTVFAEAGPLQGTHRSEADDLDVIKQSVEALSRFLVCDGTLEDTLYRVAELASRTFCADVVGISMLVGGLLLTAMFSDPMPLSIGVDSWLDASRDPNPPPGRSSDKQETWSEHVETATRGMLGTLSLPLVVNGERVGALELHARAADAFSQTDEARAEVFVAQASITLANAQAYWDARRRVDGLNAVMKSRAIIEQATGILMACGGTSSDDAFQTLVRASEREKRKLLDVAADVITRAEARSPHKARRARI